MGHSFGKNSESTIEDFIDQINIVDVIGRAVPLRRAGANYKGLCPFHNEKTPSFIVSEQKQIFTCFGCEASGNVIEFTKRYYNLDFIEAVEKLAKENGLDPYRYLLWILREAPKAAENEADWPERFLPEAAPDSCKTNT